jgi:hypothetical protein
MQINVDKMKGLRVIEFVQVYLFNRPPYFSKLCRNTYFGSRKL